VTHYWQSDKMRARVSHQNYAKLDSGEIVPYDLASESETLQDVSWDDLVYIGQGEYSHSDISMRTRIAIRSLREFKIYLPEKPIKSNRRIPRPADHSRPMNARPG